MKKVLKKIVISLFVIGFVLGWAIPVANIIEDYVEIYNYNPSIEDSTSSSLSTIWPYTYDMAADTGLASFNLASTDIYILDGFYLDSNYSTMITDPFYILSMENKVLYVKWEVREFVVTFYYDRDNLYNNFELVVSALDNVITIPTPDSSIIKEHYFFENWIDDNSTVYDFGSTYIVVSNNVVFYLNWVGVEYDIVYKHIRGLITDVPSTYTYSEGLVLPTTLSKPGHVFDGWYTDHNFTNRIYSISNTAYGTQTLYAKWTKSVSMNVRTNTIAVTHGNYWDQHYDEISLETFFGYTSKELRDLGYVTINITVQFEVWRVERGYQEIYICNGSTYISKVLYSTTIYEYNIDSTNLNIVRAEITANISLLDLIYDKIYIFCVSNGNIEEWYTQNVVVSMSTEQVFTCEHDYAYVSLGENGHRTTCVCGETRVESHAVNASEALGRYANCICCGYRVNLLTGPIISPLNSTYLISENGSYVLQNGVIVLVEEDYTSYINGVLIFYENKNNEYI